MDVIDETMKIISFFVLIIFPFTLIGQGIDSMIIGKFKITNFIFHKYESNEKWKICFDNNEGEHFLFRNKNELIDSCISKVIRDDTVYVVEFSKFKIIRKRIFNYDTVKIWQYFKGSVRILFSYNYNKNGVLKSEIHHFGEYINDTIGIYSRTEFKFRRNKKWYQINYYDYQNNLVVKGRKKYKNRDFGDGVWRFYKPTGELEAKCYLDKKVAKRLMPIKDTLNLHIFFINTLHYFVKVPNVELYNSRLISHLVFRDYKYFKITDFRKKMVFVKIDKIKYM